jgi:hypothetical protein
VAEESAKARERQRQQYNKRAKEFNYKVGDRVLLDIRVVKTGDSRKFTSKYRGPFRIIKVYSNKTVDIADNTYVSQCVHVNRLKPLYETMLWQQESHPPFESTYDVGGWYRQSVQSQTAGGKAKESGKNDKSATCATSDTDDNESDWETCSDDSEEISTEETNCPPISEHAHKTVVRRNRAGQIRQGR